jgi:hypothetical protein
MPNLESEFETLLALIRSHFLLNHLARGDYLTPMVYILMITLSMT